MMTLEEYKKATAEVKTAPNLSGVACPQCGTELVWGEPSMFSVVPPMKRLICTSCEFSEVVPI